MALIEKQITDKIEVVGDVHPMVQVRRADVIEKDGVEIARSFHRHVLAPGDDISHEDPKVQAVCAAVWTDDVVAAYQAYLASQAQPVGAGA
jgi:urease accessory protein UreE